MADVLDIDNAEEFEVDDDGDRKYQLAIEFHSEVEINNFFRGHFAAEGKSEKKEGTRIRSRVFTP